MHWADRIARRLRPRDLHMFLVVVEQGNIAKAANLLATSRPAVSKTIAGLERTHHGQQMGHLGQLLHGVALLSEATIHTSPCR